MRRLILLLALSVASMLPGVAQAQQWVASWTGAVHGPYPIGNPTAQPELKFAFSSAEQGARNQSFRMIVRPDAWGPQARIRLSNAFGTKPVTFNDAFAGLQESGSAIVKATNQPILFGGQKSVTVAPGQSAVSDPVTLTFVKTPGDMMLRGRKLAVSFHVVGESGPMTWHAKALQTSYLSAPNAGPHSSEEDEAAFPYSTTSWYFLDEVDMNLPTKADVIVAFGDSITDGTGTTINGDDRWPDILSRRLHAAYGDDFVVVNQGIGGNQVVGPAEYMPAKPVPGGPSALSRLDRDITSLPGVSAVIWLEGINDFGAANASAESVMEGYTRGIAHLRQKLPGVRIFAATLTPALNSTIVSHGRAEVDAKRKALNEFLRTSKLFDGVFDFDKATMDPATGEVRLEFQPNSSTGGPGDKLHPNRAGYAAMGNAIDLQLLTGRAK
ncbi:GDSL-type esterase/lipase family protein [Reyranella sp.]|uniref:GDSL-type esterase/lipase family protein n=1 Tax=Reyranella sp. TaxID=1929291 RepID=UPI00378323A6